MLRKKTIGLDLNLKLYFSHSCIMSQKGMANEYWTDNLFSIIGFPSQEKTGSMYSALSWKPSNKNVLMLRSVLVHGICTDNVSSEFKGHRNVFASHANKTLSLWDTWQCGSSQSRQGQRKSRLANLCRLRSNPNRPSPQALCQRRLRLGFETNGLRLRCLQPSIYVCHFFHGPRSANTKPPSSSIPSWT